MYIPVILIYACIDAGVLISDCARSVRDADKRHWFKISTDTYKFSFTLLYPYNIHSIFRITDLKLVTICVSHPVLPP